MNEGPEEGRADTVAGPVARADNDGMSWTESRTPAFFAAYQGSYARRRPLTHPPLGKPRERREAPRAGSSGGGWAEGIGAPRSAAARDERRLRSRRWSR